MRPIPSQDAVAESPMVIEAHASIMKAIKACDEQVGPDGMCECARVIRSTLTLAWWTVELYKHAREEPDREQKEEE